MRIKFIENIKKMIESFTEKDAVSEDSFGMVDPVKIKKHYEKMLSDMEVSAVDIYNPNVQSLYTQACNFLALQSFKLTVASICANNHSETEKMVDDILQRFFCSVRGLLFRKLEINELTHDTNNSMKSIIGPELIEKLNKCNSEKVSQSITLAEDLIRKSLNIEDNENIQ